MTQSKWGNLRRFSAWRRLADRLLPSRDGYRPELHYMRGPGPKCREKSAHAGSAAHKGG